MEKIKQQEIIVDIILKESKMFFNVDIFNKSKQEIYTYPRFMVFYAIRKFCDLITYQYIADLFNITHASIINGVNRADNLIKYNQDFRDQFNQLFFHLAETIHEEEPLFYNESDKLKLLSEINKQLREMDILLLNNIKKTLQEWSA